MRILARSLKLSRRNLLKILAGGAVAIAGTIGLGSVLLNRNKSVTTLQSKIKHVVIIFQENHSFDSYFGTFPGANGFPAGASCPDACGNLIPPTKAGTGVQIDCSCYPKNCTQKTIDHTNTDLPHAHQASLNAINRGKMDGFITNAKSASPMLYWDGDYLDKYWNWAQNYTLHDNFFSSCSGPSLPNHNFLLAATSGPEEGSQYLLSDNPSGNSTWQSLLNSITFPQNTILEALDGASVSWRWYRSAPNSTMSSLWDPPFYYSYFKNQSITPDTMSGDFGHSSILNEDNTSLTCDTASSHNCFVTDVSSKALPQVSFLMPRGQVSDHPPYSIAAAQTYVNLVIQTLVENGYWSDVAIFLTWDDFGGFYDHVVPPAIGNGFVDENGDSVSLGIRVPSLLLSPYANRGVDHTQHNFASISKFIETLYNLPTLSSTTLDNYSDNMLSSFNFNQNPLPPPDTSPSNSIVPAAILVKDPEEISGFNPN